MNTQNHLRLIEQYQLYQRQIHSLMESMMSSLSGRLLLNDRNAQQEMVEHLCKSYPFVELMYSLDEQGVQKLKTVCSPTVTYRNRRETDKGRDRSHRPYMQIALKSEQLVSVTDPYLSCATHQLAISSIQTVTDAEGQVEGYLVLNFNLQRLISYLTGDQFRAGVHPIFQLVYGVIGVLLVLVSTLLLFSAGKTLFASLDLENDLSTFAFGVVILLTLGLSVFDLGKTILEEEVLANKDIHSHDTSRRTITRFMSAIVIAVSIEALLLMFKSLLIDSSVQLQNAVWMLMAAVALLVGLGVYMKLTREPG